MPHILIAGKLHPAGIERLKTATDMTYTLVDEVSRESYLPHVAKADAVVLRTQPMTAEVIAAAP
ncbi:MAG: 3-phosphoglycerate dehydrogenase, partial [Alphaproteobacteria bacterium]|nr:3-phosphoglycerate dehydrogenase [Alphaproteobacteria bacterium]